MCQYEIMQMRISAAGYEHIFGKQLLITSPQKWDIMIMCTMTV